MLLYHLLLMTKIVNYQFHHARHYPQNGTYPRIPWNQKISLNIRKPSYVKLRKYTGLSSLQIPLSPQLSPIQCIMKLHQGLSQYKTYTLLSHQIRPETINQKATTLACKVTLFTLHFITSTIISTIKRA